MQYSPTLAIITAAAEIGIAVYAFLGKGRKPITVTAGFLLLFLALYQVLEVIICTGSDISPLLSRIPFMAIAWLPPLGVLLIALLNRNVKKWYVNFIFIFALGINLWVLFHTGFVEQSTCRIVFAFFTNPVPQYLVYCAFYWLGLLSMIILSGSGWQQMQDVHDRKLLFQMFSGSLAFIGPSVLAVFIFPEVTGGLPSVMCHFAIFLAFFLARLLYLEKKSLDRK